MKEKKIYCAPKIHCKEIQVVMQVASTENLTQKAFQGVWATGGDQQGE